MSPRIDWLTVGGTVEPWAQLGFVVSGNRIPLFGTGIEVAGDGEPGMRGWVASGVADGSTDVDGIATTAEAEGPPLFADHPLGVTSIDHVVIATDDLARTCGAIADTFDTPLKRVREVGEIRQGFHRVGSLIVEVVERAGTPPGPARLWGLALVADDLDAACARLGSERIGAPKDAVQPGRRIATVRTEAGVGVPLALMSPDLR